MCCNSMKVVNDGEGDELPNLVKEIALEPSLSTAIRGPKTTAVTYSNLRTFHH